MEVEALRLQLADCKNQLRSKTIELEKSTQLFSVFDQQVREMQTMIDSYESMKRLCTDTLIKYLTELEDKNRREKRMWLNEQSIKLGRLSSVRQSTKLLEVWEEGEAILKLQTRLRDIQSEKDEIEKLKKKTKQQGKRVTQNGKVLPPVPTDAFAKTGNDDSEFAFEESEFQNVDKNEQKEIYQFKIKLFENEERRIRE